MGRTSVDQREEEFLATHRDHIHSKSSRTFELLICGLTFVPCCAFGAISVANDCAIDEANACAKSHEFVPFVETGDERKIEPGWIFHRSTFTNDPTTGARVAQYERKPPVEPLDDQRNVTSSYRRTRTNLRGLDGSYDDSYQVQAWGNGRGGLDAEWQMFNDVWKESILSGSYYNGPAYGPYGFGGGNGYGSRGYGFGGTGFGNGGWGSSGPGPTQGEWGPGNGGGPEGLPSGGGWQGGNGPYIGPMNGEWPSTDSNRLWQNV